MFLRMAAFLFVFLIGFLAGLSYAPLMEYIQQGPSVADRGAAEPVVALEPTDTTQVSEVAPADEPKPREVQPVAVPMQGDQLTAAVGSSTGESDQSANQTVTSLSEPISESAPDAGFSGTVQATFSGVDGFLTGTGQARIVKTENGRHALRLSGIEVQDLPGLHVALLTAEAASNDIDFLGADQIVLGPVKPGSGDQEFLVPEGVNIADYPSMVIWSRPFGLIVARAEMAP